MKIIELLKNIQAIKTFNKLKMFNPQKIIQSFRGIICDDIFCDDNLSWCVSLQLAVS